MSDRLRRVGILGHTGRPGVRRTALALARRLARQGRTVRLDARLGAQTGKDGVPLPTLARWCQVLVTLGGDGTAITGARALAGARGVLLPVNLGGLGFLTVAETLDYHAGYFGMPKRERRERTDELLETFSLTEKRSERTRTLSGGMKRRLILARAMMHKPRLLILDEPTAGVDVELRLELWHYVQRINQEGTTILLTTHYLEEAEQLCDRIAFIAEGQIVGETSREGDMVVNPLKGKKLTNIRTQSKDENVLLTPPIRMSLEQAMEYIGDDELVEVTPKNIRLRKRHLSEGDRKRAERTGT